MLLIYPLNYLFTNNQFSFAFQINYGMNSVQMQFLRLLSRSVSQNITYHCLNSRAWEDDDGLTIKLQGDNDMELTSSEKTKPVVVTNECKVNAIVRVNKTLAYLTYFRWEKYFPFVRDTISLPNHPPTRSNPQQTICLNYYGQNHFRFIFGNISEVQNTKALICKRREFILIT